MHTNAMRSWLSLIGGFLWREGSTGLYVGGQLFGTVEASRGPDNRGPFTENLGFGWCDFTDCERVTTGCFVVAPLRFDARWLALEA